MEMVFKPSQGERCVPVLEFNDLRANLQMGISTSQVVGELFNERRRIKLDVVRV
jgi:hypothetical protein